MATSVFRYYIKTREKLAQTRNPVDSDIELHYATVGLHKVVSRGEALFSCCSVVELDMDGFSPSACQIVAICATLHGNSH
jgi:hypothetical protein